MASSISAAAFHILDRLKDMIVTGGGNVYSGDVEAAISSHPSVRVVAVLGIPDPQSAGSSLETSRA